MLDNTIPEVLPTHLPGNSTVAVRDLYLLLLICRLKNDTTNMLCFILSYDTMRLNFSLIVSLSRITR